MLVLGSGVIFGSFVVRPSGVWDCVRRGAKGDVSFGDRDGPGGCIVPAGDVSRSTNTDSEDVFVPGTFPRKSERATIHSNEDHLVQRQILAETRQVREHRTGFGILNVVRCSGSSHRRPGLSSGAEAGGVFSTSPTARPAPGETGAVASAIRSRSAVTPAQHQGVYGICPGGVDETFNRRVAHGDLGCTPGDESAVGDAVDDRLCPTRVGATIDDRFSKAGDRDA